jgi:hypothetical protein
MRLCMDCIHHDDTDHCTHPAEEHIETDYVTGEKKHVYPTCQDMRLMRNGVVNYCGSEGRFWEGRN